MLVCRFCQAENEDEAETCFTCAAPLSSGGPLAPGTLIASRYEILGCLGRGGMGTVYKAHDRTLDEIVALKTLRSDVAREPEIARRFRSEIKLARKVRHENVCGIHEYGEDGPLRFIAMELIDGVNLKQVLHDAPLPPTTAFDVALQVAHGLQAIHEAGIIHRDLKTSNLMRDTKGRLRLMDFGIAKKSGSDATLGGQLLGTPEYMSPEQARGQKVDFRSDLYALGIVVFEVFTGRVPFEGDSPVDTILKQLNEPPPLDGPEAASIPDPVLPVLRRALAKDPNERYASAKEAVAALETAHSTWYAEAEADVLAAVVGGAPPPGLRDRAAAAEAPTLIDARIDGLAAEPTGTLVLPRAPEERGRATAASVGARRPRGPWLLAVSAGLAAAIALGWLSLRPRADLQSSPIAPLPSPSAPAATAVPSVTSDVSPAAPTTTPAAPSPAVAARRASAPPLGALVPSAAPAAPVQPDAPPQATSAGSGSAAPVEAESAIPEPSVMAPSTPTPSSRPAPVLLPAGVPPPSPDARNRLPDYPQAMAKKATAAVVYLKILVTTGGEVKEASVMSGEEPFAAAALEAARGWRFSPPMVEGEPRDVYMIVAIPFRPPPRR